MGYGIYILRQVTTAFPLVKFQALWTLKERAPIVLKANVLQSPRQ